MKKIIVGVTGCIAAYKAPSIVSGLLATGNEVIVVMTENATKFINPRCFKVKAIGGCGKRSLETFHTSSLRLGRTHS
jgi:phosphopantothenoylcysteine synthetase/decarboxylase